MITKEQCQTLSKFLGIEFVFPNFRSLTKASGIFCINNLSYIYYDENSNTYDFLLSYDKVSFSLKTNTLDIKEILQVMEKYTEDAYKHSVRCWVERKSLHKQIGKLL